MCTEALHAALQCHHSGGLALGQVKQLDLLPHIGATHAARDGQPDTHTQRGRTKVVRLICPHESSSEAVQLLPV